MRNTTSTRRISLVIAFMLLTSMSLAGQSQSHVVAAEFQRTVDLIEAERTLQGALREARASGDRNLKVAEALAALGVFYQDIGRFSQAESSFTSSIKILKESIGSENLALAPLIIHLT